MVDNLNNATECGELTPDVVTEIASTQTESTECNDTEQDVVTEIASTQTESTECNDTAQDVVTEIASTQTASTTKCDPVSDSERVCAQVSRNGDRAHSDRQPGVSTTGDSRDTETKAPGVENESDEFASSDARDSSPDALQGRHFQTLRDYKAKHFVARGASHIRQNLPCQDAAWSYHDDAVSMAAVADGHGGSAYFRSERGSRFAIEAFKTCMTRETAQNLANKLANHPSPKVRTEMFQWLCQSILAKWLDLVENDVANHPFEPREYANVPASAKEQYQKGNNIESAYGTTLVGALMTPEFCLLIQLGDGVCVVFDEHGAPSEPIPADELCFLNTTTSMCDKNALHEFRFTCLDRLPRAVFVASDGIEDCFHERAALYNFFRTFHGSFQEIGEEKAEQELTDFLPRLSQQGSGDDVSMASIFAPDQYENI